VAADPTAVDSARCPASQPPSAHLPLRRIPPRSSERSTVSPASLLLAAAGSSGAVETDERVGGAVAGRRHPCLSAALRRRGRAPQQAVASTQAEAPEHDVPACRLAEALDPAGPQARLIAPVGPRRRPGSRVSEAGGTLGSCSCSDDPDLVRLCVKRAVSSPLGVRRRLSASRWEPMTGVCRSAALDCGVAPKCPPGSACSSTPSAVVTSATSWR